MLVEQFIQLNSRPKLIKTYIVKSINNIDTKTFYKELIHEKQYKIKYMFSTVDKMFNVIFTNNVKFINCNTSYVAKYIDIDNIKYLTEAIKIFNNIKKNDNYKDIVDFLFVVPYTQIPEKYIFTKLDTHNVKYGFTLRYTHMDDLFELDNCKTIEQLIHLFREYIKRISNKSYNYVTDVINYFTELIKLLQTAKDNNINISFDCEVDTYKQEFTFTILFDNLQDYQLFINSYIQAQDLAQI